MAKGDQATAQQATNTLGNQAQQNLSNTQNQVSGNLNTMNSQFQAPYLNAINQQGNNYTELMNNYRNFLSGGNFGSGGNYNQNSGPGGYGGTIPMTMPTPGGANNGPVSGGPINTQGSMLSQQVQPGGYTSSLNGTPNASNPGITGSMGVGSSLPQANNGAVVAGSSLPQANGTINVGNWNNPQVSGMTGNWNPTGASPGGAINGGYTGLANGGQGLGPNYGNQGNQITTGSIGSGLVPGNVIGSQQVNNGMGNLTGGAQNPQQGSPSGSGGAANNYGNLSDPNQWMALVGNPQQLQQWVQSGLGPNASPSLVQYYVGKIQGQPGANPTEQAGSANYWMQKLQSDPSVTGGAPNAPSGGYPGAINSALGGYNNFALTGGFSPQDIQDMQARSAAPIRGIYSQAQQELDRSKSLNNGISPNYAAASASMNRDMSNNIANQLQSTDASIAQMRQQGQLAGLSGLGQTGLLGQGQNLSAIQGMSGLYGTAPGAASTFGNQYLQSGLGSASNQINLAQLQNALNMGLIGANQTNATIPSTSQNVMNNVTWGLNTAGKVGSMIGGMA